jgi:hypothetical protein
MDLTATVFDGVSGNGIPLASVSMVDPGFKPAGGGVVADGGGVFHINSPLLDQGYQLQISSAGYQPIIVPPFILAEDGGITLDRSGNLEPVVITATARKKIPIGWVLGGVGLLIVLLYAAQKKGKLGGMSSKEWTDIALKIGIAAGLFFLVVVPLLKKFGLWGQSQQADANAKAVDDSLKQIKEQGGTQGTATKTDAEYVGMANQIYDLGGDDPVDQVKVRNVVIQVNTLTDMLSLVKAFGTRKVGGAFFSLCGFFSVNCPEMDFPTFIKTVAPDQVHTINNYLSATGINYSI